MTTRPTTSSTKKLAQLKDKMSALRQEEEKICQSLSQELVQSLINAQALEIDFDVLLGGMLHVISQAKANSNKASPEQIQKVEVWQKAGQKFRRNRREGSKRQASEPAPSEGEGSKDQGSSPKSVRAQPENSTPSSGAHSSMPKREVR